MTKSEKTMARLAELRANRDAAPVVDPPARRSRSRLSGPNPHGAAYDEHVAGECFQDRLDMFRNEY